MRTACLLCALLCVAGDPVVFDAMFLIPADAFAVASFRAILETYFGPATLDSVRPDTITGAEARAAYNRTDIFRFQLLHVARIRASVDTPNATQLFQLLPSLCAGLAPMAIVDTATTTNPFSLLLDKLFSSSQLVMALGGWLLTILLCSGCWLVFLCCRPPPVVIPAAVVNQSGGLKSQYAKPTNAQGPAAVRLEWSCAAPAKPRP